MGRPRKKRAEEYTIEGEVTKEKIIDWLIKTKKVEKLAHNITKSGQPIVEDLIQEVWIFLLGYDEEKLKRAYLENYIDFLLVRIIHNQYFSTSSRFYFKFRKFQNYTDNIDDEKIRIKADRVEWMRGFES